MATTREYIERTRGAITASKLKDFMLCPELFKLKYVDEFIPEEMEEEEGKDHWKMGRAFEDLLYYGREEFCKKYRFEEKKFVKEDYARLLASEIAEGEEEIKKATKELMKNNKVEELQEVYYAKHPDDRIYLTPAQYRDILGMYREVNRQPLFDLSDPTFSNQVYLECQYKSLKLSGTLDRFSLEKNQIRDRKTSGQIDRAERDIENKFDYITQMSFYYVLVYVKHGVQCDVFLDLVGSKAPYTSMPYRISSNRLLLKMKNQIIPALNQLIECYTKNERPADCTNIEKLRKSPYYPYLQSTVMSDYLGE